MKKKCLRLFKAYKYVSGMLRKSERAYYDRHIKSCDFCSKLVSNIKEIPRSELEEKVEKITKSLVDDRGFERELLAEGCPTTDEMMRYVHGRLYSKKRTYIENHIKTCEYCREELKIIERVERKFGNDD